jgi:hypothetical protein
MKIALPVLLLLSILSFFFYDRISQKHEDLNNADQAVYQYIKASVEGNDHLFEKVLVPSAQGVLQKGYYAHPGLAKKMGNRYVIKRFPNHYNENKLYYHIEFYHALNEKYYGENLLMVKGKDGKWKSTYLGGISSDEMKQAIAGHEKEGFLVHTYKEGENVVSQN